MTVKRRFELSIILGLIFTLLLSFAGFEASCNEIENGILRLHVLANSDSDADQALKLKVRDRVLKTSEEIFNGSKTKQQALAAAKESLPKIVNAARDVVTESGYNYQVFGEICNCYFNTRVYDNFTLPAGYYDAVRIKIGSGEGKNWWCVLFPEVCLSAASDIGENLSRNSRDAVANPKDYEVRFKVVELLTTAREKINSWFS